MRVLTAAFPGGLRCKLASLLQVALARGCLLPSVGCSRVLRDKDPGFACCHIPQPGRAIQRSGEHLSAVRAELCTSNRPSMLHGLAYGLTGSRLP